MILFHYFKLYPSVRKREALGRFCVRIGIAPQNQTPPQALTLSVFHSEPVLSSFLFCFAHTLFLSPVSAQASISASAAFCLVQVCWADKKEKYLTWINTDL